MELRSGKSLAALPAKSLPTPPVTPERLVKSRKLPPQEPIYRKSLNRSWIAVCIAYSILGVIHWGYVTYNFSKDSHPNHQLFQNRLKPGWILSRKIDNSDTQYSEFRNNIPTLIMVLLGQKFLGVLMEYFATFSKSSRINWQPVKSHNVNDNTQSFSFKMLSSFSNDSLSDSSSSSPENSKKQDNETLDFYNNTQPETLRRKIFSLGFSLIFLFVLYGVSTFKILFLVTLNYFFVKKCGNNIWGPLFSWTFSISILFLNHYFQGYPFEMFSINLKWLDKYSGIGPRWFITFNFSILRMISFTMDYYWSFKSTNSVVFEPHAFDCRDCRLDQAAACEKSRISKARLKSEYGLFNYLTFITYAPLFMAGPIITFNNFTSQMNHSPKSLQPKTTALYAVRWAGAVLLMEFMMHYFYVIAIKDTRAWQGFSSLEIFTLGYFNLNFIWIKLLIIWRFFRLWALTDGISVPENMVNCMSNNYSGLEFWRGWHASYNKWLIRYLYIPLGGSSKRLLNSFVIFTFVAVWHDIQLRLLAWGWMIVIFIVPEVVCVSVFCTTAMRRRLGDWHLQVCALGGLLSIWLMMTANLVGFAVGLDGILEMARQLLKIEGFFALIWVSSVLFAFVHVQFFARAVKRL